MERGIDRIASDYADWLLNDEPHTPEEIRKGAELLRQAYDLGYFMACRLNKDGKGKFTCGVVVRKIR